MKTIETRMTDLPSIWDDHDDNGARPVNKHFTVGRGKAKYCLWTCGHCGLFYCYSVDRDGYACNKRAVEPTATVFLHIENPA